MSERESAGVWGGSTWFAPDCQPKNATKSTLIEDAIAQLRAREHTSMNSTGSNLPSFKNR